MFRLTFKLARLSLIRRSRRSYMVVLMISICIGLMLALQGLYIGMMSQLSSNLIATETGYISIFHPDKSPDNNTSNIFSPDHKLINSLKSLSPDIILSNRLIVDGTISTARKTMFSTLYGIDNYDDDNIFKLNIIMGSSQGVMLGKKLFHDLKLKIGNKIIFTTQAISGDISPIALKVSGYFKSNNIGIDGAGIIMPISLVRQYIGTTGVSQIIIHSDTDPQAVKSALQDKFTAKTWKELAPEIAQMSILIDIFNSIIFGIVLFVVFIGVCGVMIVSVLERFKEFGVMIAIGYSMRKIQLQIFTEALLLSVLGFLFGSLLGLSCLWYLITSGINLSAFSEGLEQFGMSSIIYGDIRVSFFLDLFLAIIIASFLSVIFPIIKLNKLDPIDILQGDE